MAQLPIPNKAQWEANMITYGDLHGLAYTDGSLPTDDNKLTAQYYDSCWVFWQIYDYRKALGFTESKWIGYANQGDLAYKTYGHALNPIWNTQGFRNFPHGLYQQWLRLGALVHKTDAIQLSQNAAYAPDATPLIATSIANGTPGWDGGSREAAYILESYLIAELLGEPVRPKRDAYVDQIIDHFNQWTVSKTADYVRPFMEAISSQALIQLHEQVPTHVRVVDKTIINTLITAWEWTWANCWLSAQNCFMYTDRNVATGGQEPAPDLNLLIAPVFAWLYHQTGDAKWQQRGDLVFAGGVDGAFLAGTGKQFNQNYRWSFRYIEWRESDPLTTTGGGGIDPPPPPPGTSTISKLYHTTQASIYLSVEMNTWESKFQSNGWTTIQQQIDAGYPLWIQPAALTSVFEEVVDLEAIISNPTLVNFLYNPITIDGSVNIVSTLSTSLNGTSWTDYVGATEVLASNFKYLKIRLEATAVNKRGLVRIDELRFKLSLKEIRDGGSGTVSGAYASVTFNKTFIDIDEVVVTAQYDPAWVADQSVAIYDFLDTANPQNGLKVYLFRRSDGAARTGNFSWSVKGV